MRADDGYLALREFGDGLRDPGHVPRFQEHAVTAAPRNRAQALDDLRRRHRLLHQEARPEDRGMQARHGVVERIADFVGETARRFDHHIDDQLAAARRHRQLLLLQFADRLLHAPPRVLAHVRAAIQHTVDGRRAEARLQRDFLDQKRMAHGSPRAKRRAVLMCF
jgi:hypothetical protein